MKCALCEDKECYDGKDCTKGTITQESEKMYCGKDLEVMKAACRIEARYYMKKTRLEELILFAGEMGYRRLGMAFCIGLENEARTLHEILAEDFDVSSVCCKVGGLDKDDYGLEKLHGEGVEASCNPICQATVLNKEETDLKSIDNP